VVIVTGRHGAEDDDNDDDDEEEVERLYLTLKTHKVLEDGAGKRGGRLLQHNLPVSLLRSPRIDIVRLLTYL